MIGTSALFSQKIAESSRQFRARLLYDGAAISGEIRNITINKGACGESFSIGSIYSSYIEVTLDSCEELLENKELLLQIGLVIDDTVEYIDMGHYTVSKPKTSAYSTTFTAVGRISAKLNIIPTLPEELTLSNLAAAITEATGIQIICKGVTLAGTIEEPLTGLTCREILEVITAVLGGFATEDNNGNIVISKFSTADPVSFNGDRTTTDPEFNDYDYEITGVKVIVTEEWTDEDGTVHPEVSFTDGELRQSISLKYMTEGLFTAFKDNIVGYTYRPGIVPLALGDPRLEPWDCIKFTDANGQAYTVPCLNILHTFDGGLTTTITAPGESESGTAAETKGPLAQQLKGLEVTLLSIQEAIVKRLKANEILTEDIKAATGEFTKYLKGVQILAEQIDVEGLFAKDIEATGSVKGLTFISEGTPNYKDLPPEFGAWLGLSKLKADAASLIITSGTEGETDYLEAVSTAFGTKYRVYLSEGSYGGTEESILYVDGFGINFMTRQYDESEFESLFKVDFNGVSWKGSQLITRAELEKILNDLTGGGSIVLEETDPTVPAWAKAPTKPTYTASEVGARPNNWMPTASDVGARPNTWTPSASDVGADPKGTAEEKVSGHNTNTEAHNDIRLLIEGLTTRLNTLADSDDTTLDQMSELVAYIKANRELIEGVTTNKVNVSDIIDNLTTNVSNKPLSAAQGVALKSLIDALSNAKADKATTLAGYGITDGATKDELNGVQKNLDNHTSDKVSHITAEERTAWNAKADIEDIPTKYSDLEDDIGYVKQEDFDVHKHVWEDITDRPFSSTVADVAIFENEVFTNETVELKGVYYRHYFAEQLGVKFFNHISYKLVVNGVEYTDYTVSDSSTIVFSDVAIGGKTTSLVVDGSEIRFIKLAYADYELNVSLYAVAHKIEKMHLPDDIGTVKTVNYIKPDENGNINVEGGSGSGAFNLIKNNTLTWNGDTEGRVVATNTIDPSMSYVRISSVVPTLAELQKGGSWATTGDDGTEYEEPFTSEMIVDSDTIINCFDGYVLVAKEDNVQFVDEYTNCTLPKAGIYFIYFGAEGYTSKLTTTDYTGFAKTVLKMESLTPHGHDWYGKAIDKGNTIVSTNTTAKGYVKVSDAVPTEAELRKGGTIRHYNVENNEISGDLIIGDYLSGDYSFIVQDEGITIWYGFATLVVISFNGSPTIGGVTYSDVNSPGVYFYQSEYGCMHSLTINGYTQFPMNLEKIPAELLPEGIGSGATDCDWNIMKNKPFGETTVTKETITWDGNTEGLYNVMGAFYHVLSAAPTIEDLQNGGAISVVTPDGEITVEFTAEMVMDMEAAGVGNDLIMIQTDYGGVIIATTDQAGIIEDGTTISFEKAGIYFTSMSEGYTSKLTINGYTFTETEIKPLDIKYLPESHQFGETTTTTTSAAITWDGNTDGLDSVMGMLYRVSGAVPTLEDLQSGGTITASNGAESMSLEYTADMIIDAETVGVGTNLIMLQSDLPILIATQDGATIIDGETSVSFEKAGIYFPNMEGSYISSFAINNYTFVETKTKIEKIDPKYLPSGVGGGGVTSTPTDTIKFWGDFSTRKVFGVGEDTLDALVVLHVSDAVPTLQDLQKGGFFLSSSSDTDEWSSVPFDSSQITHYGNVIVVGGGIIDGFMVAPGPTTLDFYGTQIPLPKAGIYCFSSGKYPYIQGITINEYNGFAQNFIDNPAQPPVLTVDGVAPDGNGNIKIKHPAIPKVVLIEFKDNDGSYYRTSGDKSEAYDAAYKGNGIVLGVHHEGVNRTNYYMLTRFYGITPGGTYTFKKVGSNETLVWNAEEDTVTYSNTGEIATPTTAGLMSAEDKAKLDSLISSEGVGF